MVSPVRAFVLVGTKRAAHEAVEDAFRDLWGRPRNTFESFVRETEKESFDPSLWFLAVEGDEIAGVTLCKTLANEGWVAVVGVRRPWRKRGLALALLRHAFAEYHRRGVRKVLLSVDAESITGAPRLYGRAGMRVRGERRHTPERAAPRSGPRRKIPGRLARDHLVPSHTKQTFDEGCSLR
jgi:ribosomal protein S18 acetylase RimI-like enzyme